LIGDFGAASFYAVDYRELADGLQRIEVRAFGCILEELIDRCSFRPKEIDFISFLNKLKSTCLCEESEHRPFFYQIDNFLIDAIKRLACEGTNAAH
jgi:hypothetical protein